MKRTIITKISTILLLIVLTSIQTPKLQAQEYNTLYWMDGIPQSSYSNPGIQPKPGFYLGFPGLSSIYFGFNNTGFAPMDLIKKDTDGTFYIDDTGFLSSLKSRNFLVAEYQHEILSFGFRSQRDYFSFNFTEKIGFRMGYPGDLMYLLIEGNNYFIEQNQPAQLGGLGIDGTLYHEIGVGYSREWTDYLTAGLRTKFLFGLGNIDFARTNLSLNTHPENYALLFQSDLLVNTSLPFQIAPIDSLGSDNNGNEIDAIKFITNTKNMGIAIDLGGQYKINELFTVAASVVDLGFIRWRSDAENFAMKGAFEFDGIEVDNIFSSDDENTDTFGGLLDSIKDVFNIDETMETYRTMIPTKVFVSGAFHPTEFHKFALLGRGGFYSGNFYPSVTLSYNYQPIPQFATTLSYSVIHGNFSNAGLGFHINLGPLQLYAVADNLIPAMRPHTLQTATVHFGLNIVTGYRHKGIAEPSFRW